MMTVTERGDFVCGNPGVEYDKIFTRLADVPRVHVKFPVEEDYRSGRGLFPLRRMIAEFVDRAQGGEGQWADPGPLPPREDWW
jgi:hypothetical protein